MLAINTKDIIITINNSSALRGGIHEEDEEEEQQYRQGPRSLSVLYRHRPSPARSAMSDYYSLLEVPHNASPENIRRAYRRLALKWHPDKNPPSKTEAQARFKDISEAYEALSGESRRCQYDLHGREGQDTGYHLDFARSRGTNAYNTGSAFTFIHRDPGELFREFFGSSEPFQDLYRDMHGGQRGPAVLTGGFPVYQQNFESPFRTDFIDLENLLFALFIA